MLTLLVKVWVEVKEDRLKSCHLNLREAQSAVIHQANKNTFALLSTLAKYIILSAGP